MNRKCWIEDNGKKRHLVLIGNDVYLDGNKCKVLIDDVPKQEGVKDDK